MSAWRRTAQVLLAAAALAAPLPGAAAAGDPFDWARDPAGRLAARGAWTSPVGDLSAPVTRRDLALALSALAPDPAGPPRAFTDLPAGDAATAAASEVVRRGWMTARGGAFRPAEVVTTGEADRAIVTALGLDAERRALARLRDGAGVRLRVPRGFASEVLVREAGLRHNYPSWADGAETAAGEPMHRADLAGMADRAAALAPWRVEALARFRDVRLPAMSPAQRARAESALAQVGQPYVWGGDWTTPGSPWGEQAHGGFDCSGLVWEAFRPRATSAQDAEPPPLGRTADEMAFEAPAERVPLSGLSPADLVFFGHRGPGTPRGGISHVAIALGGGWIVHSSGSRDGVSVTSLSGYWAEGMAWGRRVAGAPAPAAPAAPSAPVARVPMPAGAPRTTPVSPSQAAPSSSPPPVSEGPAPPAP